MFDVAVEAGAVLLCEHGRVLRRVLLRLSRILLEFVKDRVQVSVVLVVQVLQVLLQGLALGGLVLRLGLLRGGRLRLLECLCAGVQVAQGECGASSFGLGGVRERWERKKANVRQLRREKVLRSNRQCGKSGVQNETIGCIRGGERGAGSGAGRRLESSHGARQ